LALFERDQSNEWYPRRQGGTSAEKSFIDGNGEQVSIKLHPVGRSAHGAKRLFDKLAMYAKC
jgi:hypothetical protein